MEVEIEQTAGEIKRLKACINDLISVLALPAIWSGNEPSQIVSTLLDVLLGMLRLDLSPLERLDGRQRANRDGPVGSAPQFGCSAAGDWSSTQPLVGRCSRYAAFSDAESDRRREAVDRTLAAGASG